MSNAHGWKPSTAEPFAIVQITTGFILSQAMFVAARLGIADHLAAGPRSAADLARLVDAHPDALHRVLHALVGVGVFELGADGRFALSPLSEHLLSDNPKSLRPYVLMFGSSWSWRAWGELLHAVRTGQPAIEHVLGCGLFQHFADNPEDARIFDAAMSSRSRQEDPAVAAAYDWPAGAIVDVGGGRGTQLAAIVARTAGARGILYELPHVAQKAKAVLDEMELASRCAVESGDFFERVPAGADIYILKKVIHDWDDERACKILARCREAMGDGSRLILIEHLLPEGNELSWSKLLDLQMLVLTPGGRERSEADYSALLASARLQLSRIIPTAAGVSLIEAAPA